MKRIVCLLVFWISISAVAGCRQFPVSALQDNTPPRIGHIETSVKTLAKSDCQNTAETVTADITDESGIRQVMLWYRVGADQPYTPVKMSLIDNRYSVTVKALDTPGGEYGTWEFYITADDPAGNRSQSPLDTSVQLLACVG